MKNYHVLDIDRTAYGGPSTVHSLESYVQTGALRQHRSTLTQLDALNYAGNEMDYLRSVNRSYFSLVRTISDERLLRRADEHTAQRIMSGLFAEMRPRLEEAREEGDIIIVSDGPRPVMEALAKHLGAVAAVGRTLEEFERIAVLPKGEKLTGPDKLQRVAAVVSTLGYTLGEDARLSRGWGDASTDISFLETAALPVVVNPLNERMVALGQQPGWELVHCAALTEFGDLSGRLIPA